jgi:hypothetical protein
MALPVFMNMPGFQFGYNGALDAQAYPRDEFPMEIEPFWDPSVLDPSLRDADNSMAYYQEWSEPGQPLTRFLGEQVNLVPSFQVQSFQKNFNKPYEATGPIPRPYEQSRGSPTSSSCSSITSPCIENEWFPDIYQHQQNMEDYSLSRSASQSQGPPELGWDLKPLPMPSTGLINMSVVQGIPDPEVQGIPNPQEVAFNEDEYDMEIDSRIDFPMDSESRTIRKEKSREHYRHSSDEGIGLSLKSEGSPEPKRSESAMSEDAEGDVDAEGEDVNEFEENMNEAEDPVAEEEDQDEDYKPKAPRNKRRRPSRASSSSSSNKKHKVTKAPSRKTQFQCKTCDHYAKDAAALTRHVAAAHTRPYICTFSFAGCKSTFGNKNEWKRHVSSQHLGLQHWVCSEGSCSPSKSNSSIKDANSNRLKTTSNAFNRKDLFTQHLKRMHSPFSVKRQGKKNSEWDERVKELQSSCLVIRRDPPSKTKCPVRQCGQTFEGATSWDDRMEHVGRHLEKTTLSPNGDAANNAIEQESDEFMTQWALKERIIERKGSGYRFCNDGPTDNEDGDADGEEE